MQEPLVLHLQFCLVMALLVLVLALEVLPQI
jgi:hypothetical protein